MPEDRGAVQASGSREERQQALAVKVCGGSAPGGVDKSGVEIQVDDRHPAEAVGFDPARPAGEEGLPDAAFIIAAFSPPQRFVVGRGRATVVTGEGDQGVMIDALGPELCQEAADAVVHVVDAGGEQGRDVRGFG